MGISSLSSLTHSKNVQYSAPERAQASMYIAPSSSQTDSPLTQIALNSVQLEQIISLHQVIVADPLLTKHDSPLSPMDKETLIQAIFQKILISYQEIKWDSLDHDVLIRLEDSEGMNIFLIATQEGNGGCLEKLIQELGYERLISAKDSSGGNALHLAAIYGHTHLIDLFISNAYFSPQDQDASQLTPFHWAIHEGQLESLQKLLRGSSIGDSWTPLAYPDLHISTLALAVASGHSGIISLLLSHNTFNQLNLLEPIASFGTIFHLIIHANQSHVLQLLMGNHEQMRELFEAKDFAERTPLQLAAFLGDLTAIHTLVKGGCLINQGALDSSGTPLLFAAKGEKPDAIQLLITLGGDPQLSDKNGLTPLRHLKQQKELSYPGIRCKNFLENIQHTIKLEKTKAVRMGERLPVNLVLDSFSQQKVIYQGLIQALEKKKILSDLSRVSGKGMGAVIATLIACGYTAQDLEEKLPSSLFSLFLAEESEEEELSLGAKKLMLQEEANVETFVSKRCDHSFYDHTRFQQEIDNLIFEKIGLENYTFGDLAVKVRENPSLYKHLHLFITSVQEQKLIRITSEDAKWKDITISSVLTASLAFPKVFSPITLLGKNAEGDVDSLFHSKTYTAPPRAQLVVEAFDDECYQEDPYFKGRKTNDRTLYFSIHEELENMPAFQEVASEYLLRYLMQGSQRQTMKNIQESSYGRVMILNLSKASESEEDLMTLSQTLIEEHLSKVSIPSIQHSKASRVFSLTNVPTPWKYRLFLEAPQIYTPPTLAKKGKYEDLPSLPLSFIERNQEFESIEEAFKQHSRVAISGLGGVGKSTLAMKYGHAYKDHYEFTLFAKVSSEIELIEKLLELAKGLKIIEEKPQDTLKILKAKLHRMTNPYLFIIDGFDHEELFPLLKNYLPETSQCKILMTTRIGFTAEVEGFYKMDLNSFKPEEAMSYLLQGKEHQGANQEKESVKKITHKLGYLPLALAHAAGYIKRQKCSFKKYHTLLKKYHLELFHEKNITMPQGERSILTTWHISISTITEMTDGALAKELIERIACLGEGLIPFPLLEAWLSLSEFKKDELALRRALEHLMNYSLINFQKEKISKTPFYAVHSLVQQVVKYQLNSDEKKKKLSEITAALDTELSRLRKVDEYERIILTEYGVHAAFILATDAFKDDSSLNKKGGFIENTSDIYYKLCSFDKALECVQEGLDIKQKFYGEESPYTAESYEA
ncbi:MAG: ankyrin repeat domain-containing protein, partial [Candidatus Rhabdochlamydia sp.]